MEKHLVDFILMRSVDTDLGCLGELLAIAVEGLVTASAKCDQVFGAVIAEAASRPDMVNLEVFRCTTILAVPIVPL